MDLSHPSFRKLASSPGNIESIIKWMGQYLGSNRVVIWQDMRRLGIRDELEDLLKYETEGQEHTAFFQLFTIDEAVYREVIIEFMMTYEFHERMDITDRKKISFRYRGKRHHISVGDFGFYLGLYTQSQVQSDWFTKSFQSISSLPSRGHKDIWRELAGSEFKSCVKSSRMIRPAHHALHKLLCCTIFGKKEGGATTADELKFMDAIIGKRNLNVAYILAERLVRERIGEKPVFLGAIITRLLVGMGILTDSHREEYTLHTSSLPFDLEYCKLIQMIDETDDRQCLWYYTRQPIPGCFMTRKRAATSVRDVDPRSETPAAAETAEPARGAGTSVQPT